LLLKVLVNIVLPDCLCRVAFVNHTSSVHYSDAVLKQGGSEYDYNLSDMKYTELPAGLLVNTVVYYDEPVVSIQAN
jgi:hypothetical protein